MAGGHGGASRFGAAGGAGGVGDSGQDGQPGTVDASGYGSGGGGGAAGGGMGGAGGGVGGGAGGTGGTASNVNGGAGGDGTGRGGGGGGGGGSAGYIGSGAALARSGFDVAGGYGGNGGGSINSGGGGGGAGGYGAIVSGTDITNASNVSGGNGGGGYGASRGGDGGLGFVATAAGVKVLNSATISGGEGGYLFMSWMGGDGGDGIVFANSASGASLTNSGEVRGGDGDLAGGDGAVFFGDGATLTNQSSAFIAGGGSGGGYSSGRGLSGVGVEFLGSGATVTNAGYIAGGAGGGSMSDGIPGAGGIGVEFAKSGGRLVNSGFIHGGDGGYQNMFGPVGGAAGVVGAGLTIVNDGQISAGNDYYENVDAVTFTGGANVLALGENGYFRGNVDIAAGTLTFDQGAGASEGVPADVLSYDTFIGAGAVIKAGSGILTLGYANYYSGGTTITAGTLDLAQAGSAGTGAISFQASAGSTATLAVDASAQPASGATFATTLDQFGTNDALDLKGFAFNAMTTKVTYDAAGHLLTVGSGSASESFKLTNEMPGVGGKFYAHDDGAGGTRIDTLGTTGPAAPGAPDLASASDTGRSNSDNITSIAKPTFTGKAAAGSTVTLFDGSRKVGTAVATSAGTYAIMPSSLADGSHTLTVTVTDTAGNTSAPSAGLSVVIDTLRPGRPAPPTLTAASDTGPSSTDGITKVTTPTLKGTTEARALVTLYDGSTVVGSAVADTNGAYAIKSTALAEGSHTLTITATDVAGNVSAASPMETIVVDTTAPSAPPAPALLSTSDTGASSSDGLTNDATPTFRGTAEARSTVTLYDGTRKVGTAVATNTGAYSITSSTLANGSHDLTVTSTDLAGNVSAGSSATSVVIDTLAPGRPAAPTLAAGSDSGRSSTDNVTNVARPTFTGTVEAGSSVTLYDGMTKVGSAVAASSGVYSVTSSNLTNGSHTLTVTATDAAGNVSGTSAGRTVVIDTVRPGRPDAPMLAPSSDTGTSSSDGVTSDTTPTFKGTAEARSTVTLYDGSTVVGSIVANASGAYTVTSSTLAPGSHAITVTATDAAGNVSAHSPTDTVVIETMSGQGASHAAVQSAGNYGAASLNSMIQAMASMAPSAAGTISPTASTPQPQPTLAAAHG